MQSVRPVTSLYFSINKSNSIWLHATTPQHWNIYCWTSFRLKMTRLRAPAKATGAAFILQPPTGSPAGTATALGWGGCTCRFLVHRTPSLWLQGQSTQSPASVGTTQPPCIWDSLSSGIVDGSWTQISTSLKTHHSISSPRVAASQLVLRPPTLKSPVPLSAPLGSILFNIY